MESHRLSERSSPAPFEYIQPSFRGLSPFLEKNEHYKGFIDDFLKEPKGFLVEKITDTSSSTPTGYVARNKEGYTDIVEALGVQVFRFSLNNHGTTVVKVRSKLVPVFRTLQKTAKTDVHSVYFVITSPFHFRMDVPCLWEYTSGGRLVKEQHPICQKDWKYIPKIQDDQNSDDEDEYDVDFDGEHCDDGDSDDEEPVELEHRNKYRFNPVFLSLSNEAMRNPIRQTIYYWDNRVKPEVPAEAIIEYKFVQKRRRK